MQDIELISIQEMKPIRIITHKTRLHDLRFLQLANDRECLLVAAEDKNGRRL